MTVVAIVCFLVSANAQESSYRVTYSVDVVKVYKYNNVEHFTKGFRTESKSFDVTAKDANEAERKAMSACNIYCRGEEYYGVERNNEQIPSGRDYKVYLRRIPSLSSVLEM